MKQIIKDSAQRAEAAAGLCSLGTAKAAHLDNIINTDTYNITQNSSLQIILTDAE